MIPATDRNCKNKKYLWYDNFHRYASFLNNLWNEIGRLTTFQCKDHHFYPQQHYRRDIGQFNASVALTSVAQNKVTNLSQPNPFPRYVRYNKQQKYASIKNILKPILRSLMLTVCKECSIKIQEGIPRCDIGSQILVFFLFKRKKWIFN